MFTPLLGTPALGFPILESFQRVLRNYPNWSAQSLFFCYTWDDSSLCPANNGWVRQTGRGRKLKSRDHL